MNRRREIFRRIFSALALVAVSLFVATNALAQCPLCRTALENRNDSSARTINLAILVLLIPPVSIFCSIFALAYKKRKGGEGEDE
ncbi:MAG TPA: hypothetical protein VLJ61_01995 [Pyrinomonadaceae bacterium]|nr:hypothetical protein [Pyrinomonadaceae bacterium]